MNHNDNKKISLSNHSIMDIINEIDDIPINRRINKKGNLMKKTKKLSDNNTSNKFHFQLKNILPLNATQKKFFESYSNGYNISAHGTAGTGKTYCALYLALNEILNQDNPKRNKIVIIRSVVPSRDIGFLPGNIKDKTKVYEEPYKEICDDLFGRGDGYDVLKMRKIVEFTTTSFLRGTTFNNCIIIVDEINNMTFQELDTIMTRVGKDSKIVFCGDYRQSDLKENEKIGLHSFLKIIKRMKEFSHIEFTTNDVVRSGLVKSYILTKEGINV